jgi:predicted nuclease of predicted toxin-antitoxin system
MQPDWEIWLDTNISPAIAKWMNEHTGISVKTSYSLSLHHLTDLHIYQRARAQGNVILLSKDADFPELISRLGSPPKLITLKIGNCDNRTLWDFLLPHIQKAFELLASSETDIIELDYLSQQFVVTV